MVGFADCVIVGASGRPCHGCRERRTTATTGNASGNASGNGVERTQGETMISQLTRRGFMKVSGVSAIALSLPVLTACPAWLVNVYSDILKYAPVALSALASILSI